MPVIPSANAPAGVANPKAPIRRRVQTTHGKRRAFLCGKFIGDRASLNAQNLAVGSPRPDCSVNALGESADRAHPDGQLQFTKSPVVETPQGAGGIRRDPQITIRSLEHRTHVRAAQTFALAPLLKFPCLPPLQPAVTRANPNPATRDGGDTTGIAAGPAFRAGHGIPFIAAPACQRTILQSRPHRAVRILTNRTRGFKRQAGSMWAALQNG